MSHHDPNYNVKNIGGAAPQLKYHRRRQYGIALLNLFVLWYVFIKRQIFPSTCQNFT